MFQDQHDEAERDKKRQRCEQELVCQQANQVAEDHYAAYVNGLSTDHNLFKTPFGNLHQPSSWPLRSHKFKPFEKVVPYESASISEGPFCEAVVTNDPGKPRSELAKDLKYAVAYKTRVSADTRTSVHT
jgi:hypothetical protein